jgi:hypothetical protein
MAQLKHSARIFLPDVAFFVVYLFTYLQNTLLTLSPVDLSSVYRSAHLTSEYRHLPTTRMCNHVWFLIQTLMLATI